MPEYKSTAYGLFTKDGMGPRTRAGIFAVLGNRDQGRDRTMPGAFTKTITENARHFRHLWNHGFHAPPTAKVETVYEISKADLPEAVLAMAPDALGGAVVVRTYLDTDKGNEILAALDAGAINEMSFAYDAIKKEYVTENADGIEIECRVIREVKLYETSDVLWGMNPATLATLSMPVEMLAENLKSLVAELKAGRRNSEADMKLIQQIHDNCAALGAACAEKMAEPEKEEEEAEEPKVLSAAAALKEADALMVRLRLASLDLAA